MERSVEINNAAGDALVVTLAVEGEREGAMLTIGGVRYHFERILRQQLISEYSVDTDPDYKPQSDAEGYCYILAPFSK